MSVVLWLVSGLIAGWLASLLAGNRAGRVTYLVLGCIGALVGGFLFSLFGGLDVTTPGLLTAVAGSIVVLTLYLGISRRRT
ncbi:MAG TPA: GlsB/YeaQ/YmgE family stress response membrane protein [Aliidongia sp.]|uniref:GlsB/YeaQ/YmgE family stress response membrane protein n=1 Tax=Aliidongia sp. TaxID=1914230 RepID=UPI002DDCAB93|nr:GlsB/YeaQ/YmgE family stress response membrane protein [Aliidongia sp.]HEV2676469.1 GlsB/YeaQ/YmgE family stress response membrane protein [Aliidongia sp.]